MSSLTGGNQDLIKKILFALFILILYRLGTYIPLPGVNLVVLDSIIQSQSKGILGMFNVLTGGALGRMSVFTLNIMPYITASIIMQLLTVMSKEIGELRKTGSQGRQKINQYSKYLAVFLALFQGYGIVIGLESLGHDGVSLVREGGLYFRITSTLTLLGGTVIVIWFSDQINSKGIGNGSSLIIFSGIVAGLLPSISSLLEMGRNNVISTFVILVCFLVILLMFFLVTFVEKSYRRLVIQYPRKQVGNKIYGGDSTHLPIKVNVSGVIPPIFANAILLFPMTISGFVNTGQMSVWQSFVANHLSQGKVLYILLYVAFIIFFSFFYSGIMFNPDDTAENLRKNGAIILGRRPGKQTRDYIEYILLRITLIGAVYIALICALPEIMMSQFNISFYLGGTSLLIIVSVVLDLTSQIQSHLLGNKYMRLMNRSGIMRKKK